MALQKTKIKIPMVAGINDKVSEIIKTPEIFQELENVNLKTYGEIQKRSGFTEKVGTGTGTYVKIHEKKEELLIIDDDVLKKYTDDSTGNTYNIGTVRNNYLPSEILALSNASGIYWFNYAIDTGNNILLYSYIVYDLTSLDSDIGDTVWGVYDLDQRQFISRDATTDFGNAVSMKSIWALDFLWIAIVFDETGTDAIGTILMDITGATTPGPAISDVPTGPNPGDFDLVTDDTSVFMAFKDSTGDLIVKKMGISSIASITIAGIDHTNITLDVAGGKLYVTYINSSKVLKMSTITTSTFSAVDSTTTLVTYPSEYNDPHNITSVINATDDKLYVYVDRLTDYVASPLTQSLTGIEYVTYGLTSTTVGSKTVYCNSAVRIAGKPYVDGNNLNIVPVMVEDLGRIDTSIIISQHVTVNVNEAVLLGHYFSGTAGEQDDGLKFHYKSNFYSYGFAAYLRAEIDHYDAVSNDAVFRNYIKIISWDSQTKPGMINFNNYTFITGNYLHIYDGIELLEHGFIHSPFVEADEKYTVNGSFSDSTVIIKCIFQYTDNYGYIHRSSVSAPYTVVFTGGGATQGVDLSIAGLPVTNKQTNKVEVLVYRTEADGTVFYLDGSVITNSDTNNLYTMDGANESTLIQNELVYTETGEDDNKAMGATEIITAFDSRLCCVDKENPETILYSKQDLIEFYTLVPGINVPRHSDEITALSELDGRLIVFGSTDKHVVAGQGADITGAGNYLAPREIPSEHGAINQDAVVLSSTGIFFKSREGIYLLDRGLNTSYIGAPVESYNGDTINDCRSVNELNEIRFHTDNESILVYNYELRQWHVSTTNSNASIVSTTVYKNDFIRTDGNKIWIEDISNFEDGGVSYNMRLKTAWIKLADITGFQRIYTGTLTGRTIQGHTITLDIYYDYETVSSETLNLTWSGSANSDYEIEFKPARQRCKAIQFEMSFGGSNAIAQIAGLEIIAGIKGIKHKITKANRMV